MHRRLGLTAVFAIASLGVGACVSPPPPVTEMRVDCGRFEGPDCNDLLELGVDALAGRRPDPPVVVAVDGACPPNARCAASELGGETVAVIVRWLDGAVAWATIPLPADWPGHPPGPATAMTDPPPVHLVELVGG